MKLKSVKLIKPLSDKNMDFLDEIGLQVKDLTLKCSEDDEKTYIKKKGNRYYIYCYDDRSPVASILIQRDTTKLQVVDVNEQRIERALMRMSDPQNVGQKHA